MKVRKLPYPFLRGQPLKSYSKILVFTELLVFFADFEDFSRCAFSLQGKKKSLSFLTFSPLSIFKS